MRSLVLTAFLAMVLSALGLLLGARQAAAQTATDTFQVRAQVTKTCTIVANDLDFGVYNSSQQSRASTDMTVQCTPLTSFSVEVGGGSSGNRNDRWMDGPALNKLRYGLYKDGGYTQPMMTTGSDFTGQSDPQGTPIRYEIYGQIVSNQTVPAGDYLDTVTVTVTY